MRKKILFKVKYVRVYLMLNAVSVNTIDYKSIALPAELQGHNLINQVFSLKDQLNQSIINPVSFRCLLAVHSIIVSCSLFVTNLLVSSRCLNKEKQCRLLS